MIMLETYNSFYIKFPYASNLQMIISNLKPFFPIAFGRFIAESALLYIWCNYHITTYSRFVIQPGAGQSVKSEEC